LQGTLLIERLRGIDDLMGICQGTEVKVILGVHARRDVDVELEKLQDLFALPASHLHVVHLDVLEYLAEVDVPDSLVVPDFGGEDDGAQHHALPVARVDVDLRVGQQALQV
ncbi:hypothetical protein EGW08_007944, partial [Elysia chlorotica]